MSKKEKHHRHREVGRCSCGMRKRSLKTLIEHAKAKGHQVVKIPVANGGKYQAEKEQKLGSWKQ